MNKKITLEQVEKILGFELNSKVKEYLISCNLEYRELSDKEKNDYLIDVINVLTNDIVVSGKHRINDWEKGWGENLNEFKITKDFSSLIPKYHGKNKIVRWDGNLIMPITDKFDLKIHTVFVDSLLCEYTKNIENVFEFGCGPGYHLLRLNKLNNNLNLFGMDWTQSSQKIIENINKTYNTNINFNIFDFFNPDYKIKIPKSSLIYTVAALEQVGENFKTFIDYIIENKPEICIHLEPIDELLNENYLVDFLSIKYFRKRNYLKGFLPYLEKLEQENKIKIINKQRIGTGSYFIEGHSLIIWKPL